MMDPGHTGAAAGPDTPDAGPGTPPDASRRAGGVQIRACRRMLVEAFPAAFVPPGAPKRPLAIGIDRMILERLPDIPRWLLKDTLRDYCEGQRYLSALVEGAARVDLAGRPVGRVDAAAAAHAARKLAQARRIETHRRRIADMEAALDALLQAISDDEVEAAAASAGDRPVHSPRLREAAAKAETVLGRIPAGDRETRHGG